MSAFGAPPLPSGWTEHVGPGGQPYYYHAASQQSTYIRPLPAFPIVPPPIAQSSKKKEKPLVKKPIPGTEWLRVTTTEGNTFYTHKGRKESVWTAPEEIGEALLELERAEARETEQARIEQLQEEEEAMKIEREMVKEVDRIKAEVQGFVKRKKRDEPEPLDEVVITKKVRVEEDSGEGAKGGEEVNEADEEDEESGSEIEEDWQKEAAAQLAAEAEEEQRRREEEAKRIKEAEEVELQRAQELKQPLNIPDRVDLSLDEAKALFKTLLREKEINPLHPWDTSLPLFISDPRYVLLPSVSARRDAFDEYCRDRVRELRQESVKKEKAQANPGDEFDALLHEQVKSTRTVWPDFRRAWKKDRRFYGWGRDDREREKRFKHYLKELGDKKRAAAERVEADFFTLLRECGIVKSDSVWKDIKRKLSNDPRYEAVGSSSLREELFNAFLKARGWSDSKESDEVSKLQSSTPANESGDDRKLQRKREHALKEREEQVRAQRGRTEAEIGRSRLGLTKEESERVFRMLLTDAIRDPQMSWDAVLPQLKIDPRFINSPLPRDQQLHLFHSHMQQLRSKYLNSLHALFSAHAPTLAAAFTQLPLDSIEKSLPVTKLGLDSRELEKEFDKWQRERNFDARRAFGEMLTENPFVEFWGRLGKMGGEGADGGVAAEDLGEDEGEGFGGKVDMKVLAKSIDLKDIVKVLKNDKRYIMFEHVPDQRERWIRDHLAGLSAPKLSVHV